MPKSKSTPKKDACPCFECGGSARRGNTKYVCENGHQFPVHRNCRATFVHCECGAKFIATVRGDQSLGRGRGTYRAFHTTLLKEKHYGGRDKEGLQRKLVARGVATSSFSWTFKCDILDKRDGITAAEYARHTREAQAELDAEWKEQYQAKIDAWFSKAQ